VFLANSGSYSSNASLMSPATSLIVTALLDRSRLAGLAFGRHGVVVPDFTGASLGLTGEFLDGVIALSAALMTVLPGRCPDANAASPVFAEPVIETAVVGRPV